MRNAMSLKAQIRNMAKERGIPAQVILQNYMFERLLVRLSASNYKDQFILKGGLLIANIIGLNNRSTMDMDTSIRDLPLTPIAIHSAFKQICSISLGDYVEFEVKDLLPIRHDDIYGGYRLRINAHYDTLITPLSIDISTGDVITPAPIRYVLTEIFNENSTYELWAYNIETIMAEKLETILSRGITNTRPRDYYDVYILEILHGHDKATLEKALKSTAEHRGTSHLIEEYPHILETIRNNQGMLLLWENYRKQFAYAFNIQFEEIIAILKKLVQEISSDTRE